MVGDQSVGRSDRGWILLDGGQEGLVAEYPSGGGGHGGCGGIDAVSYRGAVHLFPTMGQELVEPALLPSIGQLPEHIG